MKKLFVIAALFSLFAFSTNAFALWPISHLHRHGHHGHKHHGHHRHHHISKAEKK